MKDIQKDMLLSIANDWLKWINNDKYYKINTIEDTEFIKQLFDLQKNGYIDIVYEEPNMLSSIMIIFKDIQLTPKGKVFIKSIQA